MSLIDVTAAKEADLKLKESEEKNRLLIDNAAEASLWCRMARRSSSTADWRNSPAARPKSFSPRSFLDLVHPEERELIALNYMKRVAGEDVPNNYQFRIIDKMGQTRWLQVNAVRFNWEGKPATLTMFSDVTERVKAEQAVTGQRGAVPGPDREGLGCHRRS